MRPHVVMLLLAIGACLAAVPATAQVPEIPPGFTAYQITGPGVTPPPLPFRIEGDRMVAPEDGIVTVTHSRVTTDRMEMTVDAPGAEVRIMAVRDGDFFAGFAFIVEREDNDRGMAPITMIPMGRETTLAPDASAFATAPGISRIEVVPGEASLRAGQRRRFVARVFDAAGREMGDPPPVAWYGAGGGVVVTTDGEFRSGRAGEKQVVALVEGAMGLAAVSVSEPVIARLFVRAVVPPRIAAGSRVPLEIDALDTVHRWNLDPDVEIVSSDPTVVEVDGRTLVALAPGRATVMVSADEAHEELAIEVVPAAGALSIVGSPEGTVRTGDVVRLSTTVDDARPVWAVVERGAEVWPDGVFVAEDPGTYTVMAKLGDAVATALISVEARALAGRIYINGHGLNVGTYTSDLWPQNGYVYLGTHQANQIRTYDVSDPANPILTDSITVDARVINSVKVSEDGRWLAATREGAANRKNGIVFFSLEDPAHPRLVSEYTETVTSGVHNVFWVGDLIYATNDGTGDMHIIDLSDPENPKEIGRWGIPVVGRALHDVWVQEGVAYLSYLGEGLVILDVGGAGKGGTPEEPVLVSRVFYPGGPTHSAFRYDDYVFVGDEDFSLGGTVPSEIGSDPRGPVHVIDVSDLEHPRYVGKYEVPEAGAHNFWIDEEQGILYVGYYQGGIRVVDVTGELRGDLYRQGREIAYFLPSAGIGEAKKPFAPRVWGVFPMFANGWKPTGSMLYAADYNSGLWSFTIELLERPIS